MNIYTLSISSLGYDCYDGHVVISNTKKEARELCTIHPGDEGKDIWLSDRCTVTKIGEYSGTITKPFIELSSFNAG